MMPAANQPIRAGSPETEHQHVPASLALLKQRPWHGLTTGQSCMNIIYGLAAAL
jgi:hypothetical protein